MKNLKKILIGGGVVSKSLTDNESMLQLFIMSLVILLLKGLLVMVTYNYMAPKITYNTNPNYDYRKFHQFFFYLFNHF